MKYCIALLPRHIKKAIECSLIFFSLNSFLLINMFFPNCFKWKIQQLGRSKPRSKCQVFVFPAVRRAALMKMTRLPLGTIPASKQWTHVKAQRRVTSLMVSKLSDLFPKRIMTVTALTASQLVKAAHWFLDSNSASLEAGHGLVSSLACLLSASRYTPNFREVCNRMIAITKSKQANKPGWSLKWRQCDQKHYASLNITLNILIYSI